VILGAGAFFCSRLLQCVAVCCSVLQCVTVCCSVLQCVLQCLCSFGGRRLLLLQLSLCDGQQRVAVCCSELLFFFFVLQCVCAFCAQMLNCIDSVLLCAAVRCSVFQCVAVCCSALQFVPLCCSVLVPSAHRSCNELKVRCSVLQLLQKIAVCYCALASCNHIVKSVSQCVAVCCSVLRCVAMCSVYHSV